jgi:hypothetical protein
MRIKKFKKNEYVQASDSIWVRNLTSRSIKPIDINYLSLQDQNLLLKNELENLKISKKLEIDNISYKNVIICSDGLDWEEKQKILAKVPSDKAKIICTNGSLNNWNMLGDSEIQRIINFYVVNNPYEECLNYLPFNNYYFPNVLASTKTNFKFISNYKGQIYFYKSTEGINYSSPFSEIRTVLDDYRNPICASISFAYKLGAKKILLFCCDESFEDERPGSIKMENGLYQYPQQILSQKIIDKQFFWIKDRVEIFDCSQGIKYENAEYIKEDQITDIFND